MSSYQIDDKVLVEGTIKEIIKARDGEYLVLEIEMNGLETPFRGTVRVSSDKVVKGDDHFAVTNS